MTPLIGWAIAAGVFFLLWLRQLKTKNATSVDAAWATTIALLVAAYAWSSWTTSSAERSRSPEMSPSTCTSAEP